MKMHPIALVIVFVILGLLSRGTSAHGSTPPQPAVPAPSEPVHASASLGPSWPGHGIVTRVSVSSTGNEGNQDSGYPSISQEGNYVTFTSAATNLVDNDHNGVQDVFVHSIATGRTSRVSVDWQGAEANDVSRLPAIIEGDSSGEDDYVLAFESRASNLVEGDTNGTDDIFWYDPAFPATTRESVAPDGSGGNLSSANPTMAIDRAYLAFESAATNLFSYGDDLNDHRDIYVRDLSNDNNLLMSVSKNGQQGNAWSLRPDITPAGDYVVFTSAADNLVPGDTNGTSDVFIRQVDSDWIMRVSVSSIFEQGNGASDWASISDGQFIAFASAATNLAPYDTNGASDIFVRDRATLWTSRVSVDSEGHQANGSSYAPSISADGRFVAFASDASNLVEGDTNGKSDIFVHDRATGETIRVSVAADGSQANASCYGVIIADDGQNAAFTSEASNLVPDDQNGCADVFVWRRQERTPVVIIPGLMGSRLFHDEDGEEVEVWANVDKIVDLFHTEHPLMVLALADNGIFPAEDDSEYTSVRTKSGWDGLLTRIEGSAWGQSIDKDVYESLVMHFVNDYGYTLGEDLWIYPYDWRKDLAPAAGNLHNFILTVLDQTGASQVRIVAHSMGGLVTRYFLVEDWRADLVEQAVILGTPFLGTPKSFNALLNGECLNEVSVLGMSFCLPDRGVIKALAANFPGFYELMPNPLYFSVKGGGFYGVGETIDVTGSCSDCRSYDETYHTAGNLPHNFNTGTYGQAEAFHNEIIDNLDVGPDDEWNDVPVSIVAGANHQTIAGIREYEVWTISCSLWPWLPCYPDKKTVRAPVYTTAGDGTVTRHSVSMANAATGYNLRGEASYCAFDASHLGMVRDEDVLRYVDGELGLLPRQMCPPLSTQASATVAAAAESPEDTAGAQIIARGGKAIQAFDAAGHYTGTDDETGLRSVGIPGSTYSELEGLATVGLRTGEPYTIIIEPLGHVPLDITLLRTLGDRTLTTTLYADISVTADSRVTLTGDPGVVNTWQLDADGGGGATQPVSPTAEFGVDSEMDTIPPKLDIAISGTKTVGGWYTGPVTVTLSATDNPTGTGVARIDYATSNDTSVQSYNGPFLTDGEVRSIQAMAVDGAMNTTAKEIWIGPRVLLPLVMR